MTELGTIEELPLEYRESLTSHNLLPLWPSLRAFLPYGIPERNTDPMLWRYQDIRPLLMQAGELTPIQKAERRVLILANPGLGLETARATPTIYLGMQLIQPRENAPNHKHSPSAVRFVVEGEGGYTCVEGEKLPMEKGDLILTPSGLWHEHEHEGSGPVVWLDALDLPLVYSIEASYCTEGARQTLLDTPDRSQTQFRRSGLMPYGQLVNRRDKYPLLRFPWREARTALSDLARSTPVDELVHLAYVNPQTGEECLPILGFSAIMLRPGETANPPRRSASSVIHVIEGQGEASIDGKDFVFDEADTLAIPTHAQWAVRNSSSSKPAYLFLVDDAPMQRKLGFYEEF